MKKKIIAFVSLMIVAITLFLVGTKIFAAAEESGSTININSRSYYLIDFDSGEEIISAGKNKRLPIASMVKIMTLDIIFDEIENGKLLLDDDIAISDRASSMGGSQAFLDSGSVYKAEELIKSIIVASANDSCVAMAEHISGNVESFVAKMNEKALELKMLNTNFVNCTGLPAKNEYSSAEDVAIMSRDMMKHKQFFDYSRIWTFDFVHPGGRITTLTNTNKLSRFYNGCDGGKTGFTTEARSCLSATAKRDGMRLLCVVIGAPSSKERNAEVSELFNFGFANYKNDKVVSFDCLKESRVKVIGGKKEFASVIPEKEIFALSKKDSSKIDYSFETKLNDVSAPIVKGDKAGILTVYRNGETYKEINLLFDDDVDKLSYGDCVLDIARNW